MKQQIIFHIDVNSAFLSWEATYRMRELGSPEDLRLIPVVLWVNTSCTRGKMYW